MQGLASAGEQRPLADDVLGLGHRVGERGVRGRPAVAAGQALVTHELAGDASLLGA